MSAINQLLGVARAYGEAEKIELTAVSSRVFDDGKKLGALESGRDIQVKRLEAALRWFSANWPKNVPWPDGIPRPDVSTLGTDSSAAEREAEQACARHD